MVAPASPKKISSVHWGVFSLITRVAFILPAKRRSSEEEHQKGAITSPISWPQTKASRQAAYWRWCISDQRAWSCQQPGPAQQPDCSWIDLSLWSEQTLTAGTVYAKKRWQSKIYPLLCGNRHCAGGEGLSLRAHTIIQAHICYNYH